MDKIEDTNVTLNMLKEEVKKFCEARDWDQYHSPKELAIGISTEAGELLDNFRFKSEKEMEKLFEDKNKREEICDELSDVFYFVLRFAQMNNIDLSKSLMEKMKKNSEKYPIEKVKGLNKKYNEY